MERSIYLLVLLSIGILLQATTTLAADTTCTTDADCAKGAVDGYKCGTTSKICECDTGKHINGGETQCLADATTDTPACDEVSQCAANWGEKGLCGADKKCACPSNHFLKGKECTFITDVDCTANTDCSPTADAAYTCDTTAKKCLCPASTQPNSGKSLCLADATTDKPACDEVSQCATNWGKKGLCGTDKKCACPSNHFLKGKECTFITDVDCNADTECSPTADAAYTCDTTAKKCLCPASTQPNSGKSLCLADATEAKPACDEVVQCQAIWGAQGQCKSSKCDCNDHYALKKDSKCTFLVDTNCTKNDECAGGVISDYTCNADSKKCGCPTGKKINSAVSQCLDDATAAKPACTEEVQCKTIWGADGQCKSSNCACQDNYILKDSCTFIADVNCTKNDECSATVGSECDTVAKSCKCPAGTQISAVKKACVADATELEPDCEEDIQCTANWGERSQCTNKNCTCVSDHILQNSTCTFVTGVNCTIDADCTAGYKCGTDSKKCGCPDSKVPNKDETKCLTISTHDAPACEEESQCTTNWGEHSTCNKNCACVEKYSLKGNTCSGAGMNTAVFGLVSMALYVLVNSRRAI